MDTAQYNKLKRICDTLDLNKNDHLLEIGTGWGGLAMFAAEHYGCHVTTTTISDEQYDYVLQEIKNRKLDNQITLLKKDYRLLTGEYDKLVSIEMIEAVGHHYFNTFFEKCDQLLKKGGRFFLQAITIEDWQYERYIRDVDFIRSTIFPGGCLLCVAAIAEALKQKTKMRITELIDIGPSYVKTLAHWRENLLKNQDEIKALGFDNRLIRQFEYYFASCEAGFSNGYISDIHVLMVKR